MATISKESLFEEVCSQDFLQFKFGGRGYQDQLYDSIAKTQNLAGVNVELIGVSLPKSVSAGSESTTLKLVWVTHNFAFLGGSLGCAEGEKITRAFEYGLQNNVPVVVQCRTGGARMQEGTSSLMQMAKVSVAVQAIQAAGIPFVSVLSDPTYGGVSASYAMQADVRIAVSDARIGFAGPAVILNTMCEQNQSKFDTQCPADFQSASYVLEHGQIDCVLDTTNLSPMEAQAKIESIVSTVAYLLHYTGCKKAGASSDSVAAVNVALENGNGNGNDDSQQGFNYTRSRQIDRPQSQDIIANLFDNFVELCGDGRVGRDNCIRGGLGLFHGRACVVFGTYKGHTPQSMQEANYGMASPHGYRTAMRLMKLAERFQLPVVTLVDTVGAWPTFECERDGQSEAIATNLVVMSGLKVPIITLMVGEGGSGGALGIGMGNIIGMLSGGYFGVISPEGAASILGRYTDDIHKAVQFPLDCQALATAQCIYANQLKDLGVVDEIIWEPTNTVETFQSFPILKHRITEFILSSLEKLDAMSMEELVEHRYQKYRLIGTYSILNEAGRKALIDEAVFKKGVTKRALKVDTTPSLLIKHLAEEVVTGLYSRHRGLAPAACPLQPPAATVIPTTSSRIDNNAKSILDAHGPQALAQWVRQTSPTRVFVTDTTMRDAHQSLLATRARTDDLVKGCAIAREVLKDAFSFEAWGGATFDVCMRFLDECPWDRLRELRQACPNVCLQMLIRGSNGVGYTSYPDNVVAEFVRLAAVNGMDIFRVFDCFNIVESMKVSIDAILSAGKVAEVCICYAGNLLTSSIYNIEYYRQLVQEIVAAGAHILCIKDMAGLMRPLEVAPLLEAIRSVTDLPVHFHTHATSSGSLATCMEMARCGCDIIDFATAAMSDGTSQPSLNTFVAMMQGAKNDTCIQYLDLEPYDMYWAKVRSMYSPFESGMLSGTARVFEHQIPGGQYSNLIVQCQSMGIWDRWEEVLDAYRDVNHLFGDIVKVTPSSKCVGDMALYLVTRNLKVEDLDDPIKAGSIDWPDSVVGLLKGELGFPHRGFPSAVESLILKGQSKLTTRAGLVLAPVDFAVNIESLSKQFPTVHITEELAMSSLMYPKVFSDYMKKRVVKGNLLRYLPTPVYFYAMAANQSFSMTVPNQFLGDVGVKPTPSTSSSASINGTTEVTITLKRVGPLKNSKRAILFSVNGMDQEVEVKDTTGKFVFDGPMATAGNEDELGSPMPGLIEKLLVKDGQKVSSGDILATVSAMKMEVKVTAPKDGTVSSLAVSQGTRVVEGALLMIVK